MSVFRVGNTLENQELREGFGGPGADLETWASDSPSLSLEMDFPESRERATG